MQRVKKSIIPFFLTLALLFSLIPAGTVLAADVAPNSIYLYRLTDINDTTGEKTYSSIPGKIDLPIGGTEVLFVVYNPTNTTLKDYTITTSDPTIASFDTTTMTLTGNKRGSCTITVQSNVNKTISSTYTVNVKKYIERVEFSVDKLVLETMKVYEKNTLYSYTIYPEDHDDTIRVSSSDQVNALTAWTNTKIATMDKPGDYYIFVKTETNTFALPVRVNGSGTTIGQKLELSKDVVTEKQTVKLTATVNGNVTDYKYKFFVERGYTQTILQEGPSNTCEWRPFKSGRYVVYLEVEDPTTGAIYPTCQIVDVAEDYDPINYISLTSSATTTKINTPVTLTSTAEDGYGTLSYKFAYSSNNGESWTVIKNYSSNNSVSWTPTEEGTYLIRGFVKDGAGNIERKNINIEVGSLLEADLSASSTSVVIGKTTTLTASSSGGTGTVKYKFAVQSEDGSWTVLQAYSTSNSYTWKPTATGKYKIRLFAKDSLSTVKKDIDVTVSKATLLIIGFTSSKTSMVIGDSTTLAMSTNGSNRTYKFAYKKEGSSSWTVIKDYDTQSSTVWKPTSVGTYTVRAFVTDSIDTVRKDITVTVSKNSQISIDSFTIYSTDIEVGDSVKIGSLASGGLDTLKYKYEYTRTGNNWAVIKSYSTNRYTAWVPKYAGTYTLKVTVTDGTSTVTKTVTVTVK